MAGRRLRETKRHGCGFRIAQQTFLPIDSGIENTA
jgi:hypothetical protein